MSWNFFHFLKYIICEFKTKENKAKEAINPIRHGVFLTFVVMGGGGGGGRVNSAPPLPCLCSLDWQMVEVCCICQQVIHFLWTKCHSQLFADVIVLLVTSSQIKGTYRNSQFFKYLHGMFYFCIRLIFFSFLFDNSHWNDYIFIDKRLIKL